MSRAGYAPATKARVLVVGARERSLGSAVAEAARTAGYDVYTAGVSGEAIHLDLEYDDPEEFAAALAGLQPQFVVSTVGVNEPKGMRDTEGWYLQHFGANVIGNMRLLQAYREALEDPAWFLNGVHHFVAVSSNSARIPRTRSAAYCASKAALSMALRVEAREGARNGSRLMVYGYEPGLLAGTPMTVASQGTYVGALHRMQGVGALGLPVQDLAEFIVANFRGGAALNGMMLPYDADEL